MKAAFGFFFIIFLAWPNKIFSKGVIGSLVLGFTIPATYRPVMVACDSRAMWIATSNPLNELEEPSNGTRIFLILVDITFAIHFTY